MDLFIDLFNSMHKIPASAVYVLDRRNWQNKKPIQPDHIPESKDDLRALIYRAFSKTPHIKEVVVSSQSYDEFLKKSCEKKARVGIIYKLIDEGGEKNIRNLIEENSYYPEYLIIVKVDYNNLEPENPLMLIKDFFMKMKVGRVNSKKILFLSEEKNLENILIMTDKILERAGKYLPGYSYRLPDDLIK